MTCIVGYLKDDTVYMGSDSAAVSDIDITVRQDEKMFVNGEFVIGCTTSFRMIQILRYSFVPPKITGTDLHKYMCTAFIDKVRDAFLAGGFEPSSFEDEGPMFLVGVRNRIFIVETDYQVGEHVDGIYGIGCGGDYAMSALKAYSEAGIPPEKAVIGALKIATHYSGGVRPPYLLYEGKTKKIKKI